AQGSDVVILGKLLQAGQQDLPLDLVADFLVETPDDHFARGLAGPEAGDLGVLDQFGNLLVETGVDVLALHGDFDVLLARAGVDDLDRLVELLLLFFFFISFGGRLGDGGRAFSLGAVLGFVSHWRLPPEVKKAEEAATGTRRIAVLGPSRPTRAGDGARTHHSHAGNPALQHS